MWVLGTEPGFSERAACALNHRSISPAPAVLLWGIKDAKIKPRAPRIYLSLQFSAARVLRLAFHPIKTQIHNCDPGSCDPFQSLKMPVSPRNPNQAFAVSVHHQDSG